MLPLQNQVSLLRIFLYDPGLERRSTDLGVGGGKMIPRIIRHGFDCNQHCSFRERERHTVGGLPKQGSLPNVRFPCLTCVSLCMTPTYSSKCEDT